jgi:hypothetical protein
MTIECGWFLKGPGGDNTRPYGNFSAVFLYGENSQDRRGRERHGLVGR